MRQRLLLTLSIPFVLVGCPGGNVIQFGAVLPLTGDAAIYGESVRRGVELAFEHIQARPEATYTFELTVVDSGSDPARAAELLGQLYDSGALAVIGGVTTAEALAMVSVADEAERVLLSPSASSAELTGISRHFFRVFFSDFDEGTTMGRFAVKKGLETVVILAKEERWAAAAQEIFARQFVHYGGEVLASLEFPEGSHDFSGLIDRINTLRPAAVYLAAYAEDVAVLVEQIRASGYAGRILTTHAFASPAILERVGEPARGVFLTAPPFEADSEDEPIKSFVTAYGAKYDDAPDIWSAYAYDAMMVLIEAIPNTFRTPSDFRSGLKSLVDYPGVAGVINFDEKGDVRRFPHVYQVTPNGLRDEIEMESEREKLEKELSEARERLRKAQMKQGKN